MSVEETSIEAFYAGKSILVTGATGFIGKVLIEKLLRCCPGIREIFLLMRPRNGLSIDERLQKMIRLPLFDKIRETKPSVFEKLVPVYGDVSLEGLDLPPVERNFLIERVSIIFHVAANVRFDENLKKDILVNTRSTREICILAGCMKKLKVLLHVSTAYAHSEKPVIDEIVYPCDADWRKTIQVVENVDEQTLRIFSTKYLGSMPNTYTFSKRLAEQIIYDYSKDIPCVILRPSIVVSTAQDPMPGWIDNFNGPVGMMIGGGKGILRVVYSEPRTFMDFMPVDVAVKAILLTAWQRGMRTITSDQDIHVYNCCSDKMKGVSIEELVKMALRVTADIPLEGIIWQPSAVMTANRLIYYTMLLFFHILPALLIDAILKLSGRRPLLFNIQRKIYAGTRELSHFLTHEWSFRNKKLIHLMNNILPAEYNTFSFNFEEFNVSTYFKDCLIGAKVYLLNEKMDNLEKAKLHSVRMWWIDRICSATLAILLIWFLGTARVHVMILQLLESVISG